MLYTVNGIITRENIVGDNAKYITIVTAERGKISVLVRGATKLRNKFTAPTQPFSYSEFVVYENNGKYVLNEAALKENFFYRLKDYTAVSLGTYMLSVLEYLTNDEQPEPEMLRTALNALFVISGDNKKDLRLIKGAFEMRMAYLAGFAPQIMQCAGCGLRPEEQTDKLFLNVMEGQLFCRKCNDAHRFGLHEENDRIVNEERTSQIILSLEPAEVLAMQYAMYADAGKMYSFTLDGSVAQSFMMSCEKYLENHLDHRFPVLDMLVF